MNILFISGLYPPVTKGGAELSTHYIARGLVELGHHVRVVTYGQKSTESHMDGVNVMRSPLELTAKPLFEKIHSRHVAGHLRKIIGDPHRYNVIHAHDFRSALALSHLHLPQAVVTARDYAQISGCTNDILANGSIDPGCSQDAWHCHRVAEASVLRKPFRLWQYLYNQKFRMDAFASFPKQIFISHAQEKVVKKYAVLTNQKTAVIYNPIAGDYISTPVANNVTNTVYCMGRVEMYKGVRVLLDAWKIVATQKPELKLVIVGEGAQKKAYESLVDRWGLQYRVTFQGPVPAERMRAEYDKADMVVAPHLWVEPFGRTVIEAMARGKTVISANHGGPAEIINLSQAGLLFERGSAQDLAKKIIDAHDMNRYDKRELIQTGRQWVTNNLSVKAIAQQHEIIYNS